MQGGCAFLARESEAWWYLHPLCGVYFSFTLWVPHPPPLAVIRTEQQERPVFRVRVVMQGRVSDSLLLFGVHERRLLRTISRALFSLPAAFIRPARRTRCETPTAGFAQK